MHLIMVINFYILYLKLQCFEWNNFIITCPSFLVWEWELSNIKLLLILFTSRQMAMVSFFRFYHFIAINNLGYEAAATLKALSKFFNAPVVGGVLVLVFSSENESFEC